MILLMKETVGGRVTTMLFRKILLEQQQLSPSCYFIISFIILSGVRLSPLGTAVTTGLLYQPQMIDDGDCAAIGGMKIGRGNRSTWRKPATAPLCPPQVPHDQTGLEPGSPRWRSATNRFNCGGPTSWYIERNYDRLFRIIINFLTFPSLSSFLLFPCANC
jgi:hypothetical protein